MESGTFYFSGVLAGVLDAKRKRDNIVSRLQEFDATQTAALLLFEQDMQNLVACKRPLTISTLLEEEKSVIDTGLEIVDGITINK